MNQPIHSACWSPRFESILNNALAQHRAVSLTRVDLYFLEYISVTIMDTNSDSAVISRFFASLEAKIQAYQQHKRRANKRVYATTLHYLWYQEFDRERDRKYYRAILLLDKDIRCSPEDLTIPFSLTTLIRLAWCSVLCPEPWQGNRLVHSFRWTSFRRPTSPDARPSSDDTSLSGGCSETRKASDKKSGGSVVLWAKRGDVETIQKAVEKTLYSMKCETGQHDGSDQRNYGCSRGAGRLLDDG